VTRRRQAGKVSLTVALALLVAFAVIGVGAAVVLTNGVPSGADGSVEAPPTSAATKATARPTPSPTPTVRRLAEPVLPVRDAAALPTKEGLAAALGPILASPDLGPHVSVAVRDVATGQLLYGKDPHGAYIPASTTKILTCVAALAALGPDHRFETKVVTGSAPDQIVLVGGGDPFLATEAARKRATGAKAYPVPATIEQLAAQTAKRLAGTKRVRVLVDDTLFRDRESPTWESQYVPTGVVARLSALWVNEAKLAWPAWRPRAKDPALAAADAFVAALRRAGIATAGEPTRGRAPANARVVASIRSPRLDGIVERVLRISDNDGAEVLAHHVALAEGKPATFEGAAAAVKAVLARLGVKSLDEIRLYDGSGLSRDGRLSANVLTETLVAAASPRHPELRSVLTGLPVAGYDGSLEKRFYHEPSDPGVGIVRAKTGTLSGVSSLAGVVTTRQGAVLAFALMTDKATTGDPRPPLDELAAALAECGCR
jgi:D-alanyl-D-alanine carboxypeptidase/D-alanyl-D-alanine-endopeptidase (penicillin-binding protein 4)